MSLESEILGNLGFLLSSFHNLLHGYTICDQHTIVAQLNTVEELVLLSAQQLRDFSFLVSHQSQTVLGFLLKFELKVFCGFQL